MMMPRNKAVTIPVITYKITMATAVVDEDSVDPCELLELLWLKPGTLPLVDMLPVICAMRVALGPGRWAKNICRSIVLSAVKT